MSTFDDPFEADRNLQSGCVCGQHSSAGEHEQAALRCEPVESEEKRYEGVVDSAYYWARTDDVLRFDIIEKDVMNWSDPNLVVDSLPEHEAFLKMLNTLQVAQ